MNFRDSINRFLQGRYGTDSLNLFLAILMCVSSLLSIFVWPTGLNLLSLLSLLLAVLVIFRTLSRNFQQRRAENQKFLTLTEPIRRKFSTWRRDVSSRKSAASASCKIFTCPTCHQKLRVPKGKGKICITCPKCHSDFVKRS
jgi:Ca2+/Na+ antiporter